MKVNAIEGLPWRFQVTVPGGVTATSLNVYASVDEAKADAGSLETAAESAAAPVGSPSCSQSVVRSPSVLSRWLSVGAVIPGAMLLIIISALAGSSTI